MSPSMGHCPSMCVPGPGLQPVVYSKHPNPPNLTCNKADVSHHGASSTSWRTATLRTPVQLEACHLFVSMWDCVGHHRLSLSAGRQGLGAVLGMYIQEQSSSTVTPSLICHCLWGQGVHVERITRGGELTAEQKAAILEDAPELAALLDELKSSLVEVRSRVGPLVREVRCLAYHGHWPGPWCADSFWQLRGAWGRVHPGLRTCKGEVLMSVLAVPVGRTCLHLTG